jgi:hypothetical protein
MPATPEQLTNLLTRVRADVEKALEASKPLVATGRSAVPTLPPNLKPLVEPYLARWEGESAFLEQQLKNCDELLGSLKIAKGGDMPPLMDRAQRLLVDLDRQTRLVAQERDQLDPLLRALSPTTVGGLPQSEEERALLERDGKILIDAIETKNRLIAEAEWIWARVIQFPRG